MKPAFSKWRQRLWPIHASELFMFVPLLVLKLMIAFNYNILYTTKDSVVVTTLGAEAISVLKGIVVLALAFVVMLIYSRLSNVLTLAGLFYAGVAPFMAFFLFYGFFLFPHRESLALTELSESFALLVGPGHEHWVLCIRYWMHSLYFAMAELWGAVGLSLLFWSIANQLSSISQAARFYALFSAGGHMGTLMAGPVVYITSKFYEDGSYDDTVKVLMLVVAAMCTLSMLLVTALKGRFKDLAKPAVQKKEKVKPSLRECFALLARSVPLRSIATAVICYGLAVNLVEVSWKATLRMAYPNTADYSAFMGIISTCIGALSLILALFVANNSMRKLGWYFNAMATPLALLFWSLAFFGLYFWVPTLSWIVLAGAFHNVFAKAMKYCFFDPTKEMSYITLDPDEKLKGKAVVDVTGARFGKSGASWIQIFLVDSIGHGSILPAMPFLVPCVLVSIVLWLRAITKLNRVNTKAWDIKNGAT